MLLHELMHEITHFVFSKHRQYHLIASKRKKKKNEILSKKRKGLCACLLFTCDDQIPSHSRVNAMVCRKVLTTVYRVCMRMCANV